MAPSDVPYAILGYGFMALGLVVAINYCRRPDGWVLALLGWAHKKVLRRR
jgi:hypothetical protein